MSDYEHQELERKIDALERRIDDLDYDLRRAKEELESEIRSKSDKHHSHSGVDYE